MIIRHIKGETKQCIVSGIISIILVMLATAVCYAGEAENSAPVVTFSSAIYNKYVGDTGVVFYATLIKTDDGRSSHVIGNAGFKAGF